MKHSELLKQFKEELANLSHQVEFSVAMGHFDINKFSEDVLCTILKELYGFKNLRNLDDDDRHNCPGIDLADDVERIAIQVTSDKTLKKVKKSLKTISGHGLHEKHDRIIFYILARKRRKYSKVAINVICGTKLSFHFASDTLDFRDLATWAANAEPQDEAGG